MGRSLARIVCIPAGITDIGMSSGRNSVALLARPGVYRYNGSSAREQKPAQCLTFIMYRPDFANKNRPKYRLSLRTGWNCCLKPAVCAVYHYISPVALADPPGPKGTKSFFLPLEYGGRNSILPVIAL